MGNANALVQSEDWAALINDAKARNCYLDMDSLPKDFIPEPSTYGTFSSKMSSTRGLRSGPRYRSYDSQVESRSGTPSEEDEKSNISKIPRNGSYRSLRPVPDNLLDDFDQPIDKSRDAWQHGIQKKQNGAGILGKREL